MIDPFILWLYSIIIIIIIIIGVEASVYYLTYYIYIRLLTHHVNCGLSVCVYMYVCMYVCVCVFVCVCMYVYALVCEYEDIKC